MANLTICRRIRCPGRCGGLAELEAEVTTAFRQDGSARYFRRAECQGRCPHPDGKPFAVVHEVAAERPPHLPPPTMIPTKETNTMGNTAAATKDTDTLDRDRERLRAAMKTSGHTARTLCKELGWSCYSSIYTWRAGKGGLSDQRADALMAWVDRAEKGRAPSPSAPAPAAPTLLDAYRAMLSPLLEEILREGCASRGLRLPQGVGFSVGLVAVEQP